MQNWSATPGAAEYVATGFPGVSSVYTSNRRFSLSDLIIWNERTHAKLNNAIREKMGIIPVNDPAPKVIEAAEAPVQFAVSTASSTTTNNNDTVGIANALARWLNVDDVLQVSGLWCDTDGTNYTTTKFSSGYTPEAVVVQRVIPSGISSTVAKVIVSRGNGNNPATATQITTSMVLNHIGNALIDGGAAPSSKHHEPAHVQNYCQLFSMTWSQTDSYAPLNSYGKLSMADKGAMKRRHWSRLQEYAYLWGRKAKPTSDGQDQWMTGGFVEYVPGASVALDGINRLIDFGGPFDLETFMINTEIISHYGSDTRDVFVGGKFLSSMWNHFQQSIVFNDEMSRRYGWAVWELDLGHVIFLLHRHPVYTDFSSSAADISYDAAIMDLEYIKLMVYIDAQIKPAVQLPNVHGTTMEIFSQTGLWRSFQSAHSYWYGITA